jgi:hypothetical protein
MPTFRGTETSSISWATGISVLSILLIHIFAVTTIPTAAQTDFATGDMRERLMAAGIWAVLVALGFPRLRNVGWSGIDAGLVLLSIFANAFVLYSVTNSTNAVPLIAALTLVVAALRHLETVGDVQAQMGLGLTIGLLPMAGAQAIPLIVPIVIVGAMRDRDGQSNFMAFLSLCLVLVLPSLISAISIELFWHDNTTLSYLHSSYWESLYQGFSHADIREAMVGLVPALPIFTVTVLVCILREDRTWLVSLSMVFFLPMYLEMGRQCLSWSTPPNAPALMGISACLAFLTYERLLWSLRAFVVLALLIGGGLSWLSPGPTQETEWRNAVLQPLKTVLLVLPKPSTAIASRHVDRDSVATVDLNGLDLPGKIGERRLLQAVSLRGVLSN